MPLRTRLFGALAPVVLILLLSASPASAHDTLLASTPADGATLAVAPSEVVLEMSATAIELGTQIQVLGPGGVDVVSGDPVIAERLVTVPLELTAAGEYTVQWRVVSSDGHPIDGTFAFTVTQAPTPTPEPSSAEPSTTDPATVEEITPLATDEVASPDPTGAGSDSGSDSATEASTATGEPASAGPSAGAVVALVLLVVLLVPGGWWLARRRAAAREATDG